MKTLVFVRHAESLANAGGVTMPNAQIPLSEHGWMQARALAEGFEGIPTGVLTSVFLRTQETARPLCERFGLLPQIHPLLHEFSMIDPALIEGLNLAQRRPFTEAYWLAADPDQRLGEAAETFHEFAARVEGFQVQMDELPAATLVVGHGIWFALLLWRLQGGASRGAVAMSDFRRFQKALPMPNCALHTLTRSAAGVWSARVQ